ncbi:hypothetical protein [Jeongeupia sp. USM3]|uniref:hypothetical protein n=1 Tax=Jeongeupia sp. USM3 TaxID=1906741 RepID=UPI00089DE661|nr:hypothetical protein [Jeongeupia sp. USM3]AOY00741.1 hypothetical protein BJP62_10010 [Jeongeupia sp. USM3]
MNPRAALLAELEPVAAAAENGSPPPPVEVEALLARARECSDIRLEGLALVTLGHAWQHVGRLRTAQQAFRDAAECFRDAGHARARSEALIELGRARYAGGDIAAALDTWSQCLALAHDNGDRDHCARICLGVGQAYVALGDGEAALRHHELALTLARPIGHDRLCCEALINVAGDAYRLQRYERAEAVLAEADALLQTKVSNKVWAAEVHYYRGLVCLARNDVDGALAALSAAHRAHADNLSVWGEAHACLALGQACEAAGRPGVASVHYLAGRTLAQRAGLIALHRQLLHRLVALARNGGDFATALARLHELDALGDGIAAEPRWSPARQARLAGLETRSHVLALRLALSRA